MERIIETIETEHGQDVRFKGDLVRCKDCIRRGDKHKCILAFVADKQDFPFFFYDNRGEWYCADGKRKDSDSQVTVK